MVTIIKKGASKKEIKEKISAVLSSKRQKTDISKFAGSMKLSVDPLKWQKQIRNEWE